VKKRQFERVDCRTEALISYGDRSIKGEVENLSLKGLFVKTDQKIDLHETVCVTVFFNGTSGELSFSLQGKVVRVADNGIGVNFKKIDVDSLVHTMTGPASVTQEELSEFCASLDDENPN
jgi:PilZ domain-containing protein